MVINLFIAFSPASTVSVAIFLGICAGIVIALLVAVASTARAISVANRELFRMAASLVVYFASVALLVSSGIFQRAFIPFGPLFLVLTIGAGIALGLSSLGHRLATGVPLFGLIAFQSFRLPLEVVLHSWHATGTIPQSMTWSGSNWDILTGIIALAACPFVSQRKWLAWGVNILGITLLINVIRVAVLSADVPFGWEVEPKLELIAYLPYAYIVPICVGGAAMGHVLLTRKLLLDQKTNANV